AFIAVYTTVVAHLQKKRAVPEPVAALDAFGAADAQMLIDRVFIVRVFNERSLDRCGGTEAIFGAGVEVVRSRFEISRAKLAVAANRVGVNALYGRLLEHTVRRAIAATHAFLRVNLPNSGFGSASPGDYPKQTAHSRHRSHPRAIAQKLAS